MSEWAARCPACRAALADTVPILPPADTSLLARSPVPPRAGAQPRTRSGRVVVVALAIVVAAGSLVGLAITRRHGRLAGAGAGSASGASGSAAAFAALRQYTVLYTGVSGPRLVRLDGSSDLTRMPGGLGDPERPLPVSSGVVFLNGGVAYHLAIPVHGPPLALGPADHLFAMVWPDLVGIQRGIGPGSVSVQFVSTTGASGSNSPVWQLPAGYQPVAQAGSGLLVRDGSGQLRTWSLDGGQLGPVLGHAASVIDTHNDDVAWRDSADCDKGECPLHITNVGSGADRLVSPPPSHAGFIDGGAFSPGGRLLAAFVSAPSQTSPKAQLVLMDAAAPRINRVANSVVQIGEPVGAAAWTTDSSTVLFCGNSGQMRAYRPDDKQAIIVNIPASYSFAAW